jgi:uncharacterized protein YecT (DUF1311 family)
MYLQKIVLALAIACLAFVQRPAAAESLGELSAKSHVDCAHQDTELEAKICAYRDRASAESELATLLKDMQTRYPATDAKRLVAAQRLWARFEDAECAFETAGTTDGSIHSQMVDVCLTRLAKARIAVLKSQRDCNPDADLSCNAPEPLHSERR